MIDDPLVLAILVPIGAVIYYSVDYYKRESAGEIEQPNIWGYVIFGGVLLLVCQGIALLKIKGFQLTEVDYGQYIFGLLQVQIDFLFVTLAALMFDVLFHNRKKLYNPLILGVIALFVPYLVYSVNCIFLNVNSFLVSGIWPV